MLLSAFASATESGDLHALMQLLASDVRVVTDGGGKVRAALASLAWDGSEAVIADGSAERALERSLDDPTFGTRVSVRAHAGRVGQA